LPDRIGDGLGVVGLELGCGYRDAVEEQHQIETVLIARGVAHLPHHPQAVGVVASQDLWVEPEGRFELGEFESLWQPQHLHALAKQIEAADLIELLPHPLQQRCFRLGTVVLLQHLQGLGLGLLHPGDQVRRIESQLAAVGSSAAFLVEPAVGAEMLADLALEGNLVVKAHRLRSCANSGLPEQPKRMNSSRPGIDAATA
jgi:hypothetical protein